MLVPFAIGGDKGIDCGQRSVYRGVARLPAEHIALGFTLGWLVRTCVPGIDSIETGNRYVADAD